VVSGADTESTSIIVYCARLPDACSVNLTYDIGESPINETAGQEVLSTGDASFDEVGQDRIGSAQIKPMCMLTLRNLLVLDYLAGSANKELPDTEPTCGLIG
jgi:hypothetical protein